MFCLACSDLGGVDAMLNVLLFIPLGAAVAAATGRWGAALGVPIALSLAIEALQLTAITGRDASALDLLTNSIGGVIGAGLVMYRRTLLTPAPRTAHVLSLAAVTAAVAVMASTAALLRPSIPRMGLWGQWMPQRLAFEPYSGTVHDFRIDNILVPYQLVPESERLRQELLDGTTAAHVDFTSGAQPQRLAVIARVGSSVQEVLMIGAWRDALVFRTRPAAKDWGLRTPMIALPGALADSGVRMTADAGVRDQRWYATTRGASGVVAREVPFSVALGWTFFLPFDHPLSDADRWYSALWLAALAFPAAYWGARASRRGDAWIWSGTWWSLAVVMLAAALGLVPHLAHFAPAAGSEWLGLLTGSVGGGWAALRVTPRDFAAHSA